MSPSILLLGALVAGDSIPRTVPSDPGSGSRVPAAVIVHRQPSVPVVSLRLSILTNDPPGYAGAGHMIQHLLQPRLQEQVSRVGGRVQIERTADAIVYSVTGPAAELDYLAEVLLGTLAVPQATTAEFLQAETQLREERLAEWETAHAHTRAQLRSRLFPGDISAAGTDRSTGRFTISNLPAMWASMYRPERVSVVAVGDVYLADVQREFSELPAARPGGTTVQRDTVFPGPLAPPQATRAWLAAGYLGTGLDPAAVSVVTRLLGRRIRESAPTAQVEAEHWWTHHGQAIAIIVAAPARDLAVAQRALGSAVGNLLTEIDYLGVTSAVAAIRREMLFYSRAPDRMAELLGQFVDRDGDPNAAERYYAALDALDDEDVREVLEYFLERTPVRIEVPAQVLGPPLR